MVIGAALCMLSACTQPQVEFSNFEYEVSGLHARVAATGAKLPGPALCRHYIQDNGHYSCVLRTGGDLVELAVADESGGSRSDSFSGGVVVGVNGYFAYRADRDGPAARKVWRLSSLFPQGREGVYVDCFSYDDRRLFAVTDGVEQTYDYGLRVVGAGHGRPCTVKSRSAYPRVASR